MRRIRISGRLNGESGSNRLARQFEDGLEFGVIFPQRFERDPRGIWEGKVVGVCFNAQAEDAGAVGHVDDGGFSGEKEAGNFAGKAGFFSDGQIVLKELSVELARVPKALQRSEAGAGPAGRCGEGLDLFGFLGNCGPALVADVFHRVINADSRKSMNQALEARFSGNALPIGNAGRRRS